MYTIYACTHVSIAIWFFTFFSLILFGVLPAYFMIFFSLYHSNKALTKLVLLLFSYMFWLAYIYILYTVQRYTIYNAMEFTISINHEKHAPLHQSFLINIFNSSINDNIIIIKFITFQYTYRSVNNM